ncbi:hypothetical protein [Marivita hallyeonensis]|uniref:Excalibur calcium-binding domain-containing protein n=1 Tax=Marivita hallyeonensis TaxID=996342 RepID=A0A1M5RSB9_9RHOB|nr:hypothetical protein [Marivita hallyeonensis]SHH29174.1 hypothetical protein SAMN05443551_1869 [Marivita hallyeonensis]
MRQSRSSWRVMAGGVALLALAACASEIPDSARGVGFDDYDSYQQRRDAVLEGRSAPTTVTAPPRVTAQPLTATAPVAPATPRPLDATTAEARRANSGVDPVQASPSNPAPQIVENAVGISAENDFNAVSESRSIESDAALIAQNRARYQIIAPEALPTRPGTNTPNIVAYALQTNNPKGAPIYRRSAFVTEARHQRNCAAFPSSDLAQEAFLEAGGPERDRQNLDPDGDGFACAWDPAPFRAVRN